MSQWGIMHAIDASATLHIGCLVQDRLRNLFPGLAGAMGTDRPSFFEWAFACVRSRAFRLTGQRYAFVPVLDIANHSPRPNAGFRCCHDTVQPQ